MTRPIVGYRQLLQIAYCADEVTLIEFLGGFHPQLSNRIVVFQLGDRVFAASDLGGERTAGACDTAKSGQRTSEVAGRHELVGERDGFFLLHLGWIWRGWSR